MPPQTREVNEKKEKEEEKKVDRVWKRKNALPDPRRAKMQEMTVEEKARIQTVEFRK